MVLFKDHKVGVNHLLGVIPESLLANLSKTTKVDHYAKVLHGKKLFYTRCALLNDVNLRPLQGKIHKKMNKKYA
jgi:hypothetical protein